jgi:C1A family cysteine protease
MKNKRLLKPIFTLLLALAFAVSGLLLPVSAQAKAKFNLAPLSEEFRQYMEHPDKGASISSAKGHDYGFIPSPVRITRLGKKARSSAFDDDLPPNYNTELTKNQSSVKDQGSVGSCWTFSSMAILESYFLKNGAGEYNFSERNMMNNHGFDWTYDDGGNREMAVAYLSRWDGPVNEEDDLPYDPPNADTKGSMPGNARTHLQDTLFFEDDAADVSPVKKAIREYGAVFSTVYFDDLYYNAATAAYAFTDASDPDLSSNHAITLVGWDNDFPASSFNTPVSGNGAFIAKNSWGPNWGKNGYFYISYDDVFVAKSNGYAVKSAESVSNYDKLYQHDPLGWIGSYGNGDTTAWFANVFTAGENERINAVSFYTTTPGADYQVFVAPNVSGELPDFSGAQPVASGKQSYAGYHTVAFDPVALAPSAFTVAVRVTNADGFDYSGNPIAVEYPVESYYSKAEASAGESYISLDGTGWEDVTSQDEDGFGSANVCLKAFTKAGSGGDVTGVRLVRNTYQLGVGKTFTLAATVSPSSAANKNVVWTTSDKAVATVSAAGVVTGKKAGSAVITATTVSGGLKAVCTVKVVSGSKVLNLTASKIGKTGFRLGWSKLNASGSIRYYIYQSTSKGGKYKQVADTKAAYKDIKGLKKGKTYYFKVRAKIGSKYSGYSDILKVKTKK